MGYKSLSVGALLVIGLLLMTLLPQNATAATMISQVTINPKYPQNDDALNVTAKVEDPLGISFVELHWCTIPSFICDYKNMDGPDVNDIFNGSISFYQNAIGLEVYMIAMNTASETTNSDYYYIQYALSINATMTADLTEAYPGQNFNLTVNALYYSNTSAPVEYSEVNITRQGSSEYWTGTTDMYGNFTIEIQAPASVGSYTYNATITNRSLDGYAETSILVLTEPLPDLRVGTSDIVHSPLSPTVDDTVSANITVRNVGTLNATFYVLVTISCGGNTQTLSNTSVTVNSGNLTIVSVSWNAFEGLQYINVTLDPGNFVREADEGNNFASKTITGEPKPVDLEISYTLYLIIIAILIILIIITVLLFSKRKSKQPPQE